MFFFSLRVSTVGWDDDCCLKGYSVSSHTFLLAAFSGLFCSAFFLYIFISSYIKHVLYNSLSSAVREALSFLIRFAAFVNTLPLSS